MDARLRLLTRQYEATRDPLVAIKVAEELLRSGAGGDTTVYEVEYEYLEGYRMDEKFGCGVFLTEPEAEAAVSKMILEKLEEYFQNEIEDDEEYEEDPSCAELRRLLAEKKVKEAIDHFTGTFSEEFRIIPHTFKGQQ